MRILTAAVFALMVAAATANAQESRLWKDRTGKFSVRAKLVGNENGKVTLEKPDGSTIVVELKRLSAADQKYIADNAGADGDDPFKSDDKGNAKTGMKKGAKGTKGRRGGGGSAGAMVPAPETTIDVEWSGVDILSPEPSSETWSFTASEPPADDFRPKTTPLPPKSNFFERATEMVANRKAKRIAVFYGLDDPRPEGVTRVVVCDLEKGTRILQASTSGKWAPLAMHDDGERLLVRKDTFGFGNHEVLELWKIGAEGLTREWSMTPYGDINGTGHDLKWAEFLGADRFATASDSGKLAFWSLDNPKPKSTLAIHGSCVPAVSPDGKYIAYAAEKTIGVLDSKTGAVVASQAAPPNLPWPTFAFSPNGKYVSCLSHDRLYVWDFATGKPYREMLLHNIPALGLIAWTSNTHVLLGRQALVDVVNEVIMWQYLGQDLAGAIGTRAIFAVGAGEQNPGSLLSARLPHRAAVETLEKAMKQPDFFVLKPGSKVKVDLSCIADPTEHSKALAAITANLQKNDCTVSDNGTIELKASVERGKVREITYRRIFGGFGHDTVNIQEYFVRLTFLYAGKPVWQTSSSNVPGFINIKQNEKIEDIMKQHEKPNFAFMERIELPKRLQKPMAQGSIGLGISHLNVGGIQ